jgi:hypothetical protein
MKSTGYDKEITPQGGCVDNCLIRQTPSLQDQNEFDHLTTKKLKPNFISQSQIAAPGKGLDLHL